MTINYLMLTVCFNALSFIPHSILQRQLFLPPFTRWENLRLKETESCTEGRTHSRSRAGLGTLAPHTSVRFRSSVLSQHVQKLLQAGEVGSHEGSDSERPLKLVVPVEKSLGVRLHQDGKQKALGQIRQLDSMASRPQSWPLHYTRTGRRQGELGSSQTHSSSIVPWLPPHGHHDTDMTYCLVRGTEIASNCCWTSKLPFPWTEWTRRSLLALEMWWGYKRNTGKGGCVGLTSGGNVQLHWGHWVPAVLPLYLALGSLSAGGRHPLMVAV